MRTIIVGKFSALVSTPTHTLLVAFDQYYLRGKIILYICILSLAQQHFPQWRSGFAQSVLQLFVLMIPPMCTSSPLWFTYSEMPSFSFFSGVSDLSPFIVSVRHLPDFELPLSLLASSSLKRALYRPFWLLSMHQKPNRCGPVGFGPFYWLFRDQYCRSFKEKLLVTIVRHCCTC